MIFTFKHVRHNFSSLLRCYASLSRELPYVRRSFWGCLCRTSRRRTSGRGFGCIANESRYYVLTENEIRTSHLPFHSAWLASVSNPEHLPRTALCGSFLSTSPTVLYRESAAKMRRLSQPPLPQPKTCLARSTPQVDHSLLVKEGARMGSNGAPWTKMRRA